MAAGRAYNQCVTAPLKDVALVPREQVQEAVGNCLPHLVTSPALESEIPGIVNKLMKQLLTAEKFGDRRVGISY